ncbi:MAG: hypothetical protein COC01_07995 [Bacteroidetes bacterium]|nr:MAG: hypothetical protein COC01_07995 [Bacteroidota bacterium]
MYLRYLAKYYNETTQKQETGFFWSADYLKNHGNLQVTDRQKLEELIQWFDKNLPIPNYYQSKKNHQESKSAATWFKDSSDKYIKRMNELAELLEVYNVDVQRISCKRLLGKKIFEDDYQITIIPYRDIAKKVK